MSCTDFHRQGHELPGIGRLLALTGNILILGDSINYQIFVTFLNFLRADYSHVVHSDHGFGSEEICGDILQEGRKVMIGWVWNPFLSIDTTVPYLRKWNIKTLIFNTGAKFREDAAYTWSIQKFVDFLQVHYSHVLVIFRNTPPGMLSTKLKSCPEFCFEYKRVFKMGQTLQNIISRVPNVNSLSKSTGCQLSGRSQYSSRFTKNCKLFSQAISTVCTSMNRSKNHNGRKT